jgi:hypothetical protein
VDPDGSAAEGGAADGETDGDGLGDGEAWQATTARSSTVEISPDRRNGRYRLTAARLR